MNENYRVFHKKRMAGEKVQIHVQAFRAENLVNAFCHGLRLEGKGYIAFKYENEEWRRHSDYRKSGVEYLINKNFPIVYHPLEKVKT